MIIIINCFFFYVSYKTLWIEPTGTFICWLFFNINHLAGGWSEHSLSRVLPPPLVWLLRLLFLFFGCLLWQFEQYHFPRGICKLFLMLISIAIANDRFCSNIPWALLDCDNRYDKPLDKVRRGLNSFQLFCHTPNNSSLQLLYSCIHDNTCRKSNIFHFIYSLCVIGYNLIITIYKYFQNLPITIGNVVHFWTETVSMIAAVTTIAE